MHGKTQQSRGLAARYQTIANHQSVAGKQPARGIAIGGRNLDRLYRIAAKGSAQAVPEQPRHAAAHEAQHPARALGQQQRLAGECGHGLGPCGARRAIHHSDNLAALGDDPGRHRCQQWAASGHDNALPWDPGFAFQQNGGGGQPHDTGQGPARERDDSLMRTSCDNQPGRGVGKSAIWPERIDPEARRQRPDPLAKSALHVGQRQLRPQSVAWSSLLAADGLFRTAGSFPQRLAPDLPTGGHLLVDQNNIQSGSGCRQCCVATGRAGADDDQVMRRNDHQTTPLNSTRIPLRGRT
jgi:hypothetical protein